MLLWLVLFLIIIAISFLMAYQSMKDFAEKPSVLGKDYALFLVRNPQALSLPLLEELYQASLKTGHIITLERLFKGAKSAVVIFGPKSILDHYADLNLLELEDYANVSDSEAIAWEVGTKDALMLHFGLPTVFKQLPKLGEDEQFWWQLTLKAHKGNLWQGLNATSALDKIYSVFLDILGLNPQKHDLIRLRDLIAQKPELKELIDYKNSQKVFQTEIRAAVVSANEQRRTDIALQMENIDGGKLIKLPKAYTSAQILTLYKQRAKLASSFHPLNLTADEILQLSTGN